MLETKKDMDRVTIEKLLKMSLTEVIDHLLKTNNKSKAAQTGFLMDTGTHQIDLHVIRKPISKPN